MKPIYLGSLLAVLLGCARAEETRVEFDLVEVRRYGDADLGPADSSKLVRYFGGGILADIAGVVADSGGVLNVLDRDWAKVVQFSPTGEFQRLVLGGRGEGPGEFILPIHLTPGPEGQLSVLDYKLGRVTFFGEGFEPTVIPLHRGGFFKHVVSGDTIFVTRPGVDLPDRSFVSYFSFDGDSIGAGPLHSEADRAFGSSPWLTHGLDGKLLVSTTRPGVWMEFAGGQWSRRGQPLFPELDPPREDTVSAQEIQVVPAQATASGIAVIADGFVLQGYLRFPRPFSFEDPPSHEEHEWYLAVYGADGLHHSSIRLKPGTRPDCLTARPGSSNIFLCKTEPFPQVVEYEVKQLNEHWKVNPTPKNPLGDIDRHH